MENGDSEDVVFTRSDQLGTRHSWNSFTFTLISTDYNNFESIVSTVVINAVNNSEVVCTGLSSLDMTTIRLEGIIISIIIILL